MTVDELLCVVESAGGRLTPHGETLTVEAPEPLSEALLAMLRERKFEILAALQPPTEKLPLGKVGRHGAPCPQCEDTWQWPTTRGDWVCSWCFVGDATTAPKFADDGTLLRVSMEG